MHIDNMSLVDVVESGRNFTRDVFQYVSQEDTLSAIINISTGILAITAVILSFKLLVRVIVS